MAWGNWDFHSFKFNTPPSNDVYEDEVDRVFTTSKNNFVEIYKNYILIGDPLRYRNGVNSMGSPYVVRLDEGKIKYQDLNIVAVKGPQSGIYVAAWTGYEGLDPKDEYWEENQLRGFLGIGLAWDCNEEDNWVGVGADAIKYFKTQLKKNSIFSEVPKVIVKEYNKFLKNNA